MILSVSRRTDIPMYYSDWFFNRLEEGFLYVGNPMNSHQVSKLILSPRTVELMVFWTKNPEPMLGRLLELQRIPYYIQVTLTGYGRDVEPGLQDKRRLIQIFCETAKLVGRDRMVWRYDPIFVSRRYPEAYHYHAFLEIAKGICGCTDGVVISFLDLYGKTERNMRGIGVEKLDEAGMRRIGKGLAEIAGTYGMTVTSCSEKMDLSDVGIGSASCIDPARVERILGGPVKYKKDRNQRPECGCMESADVGAYDTCPCGCAYCYANNGQNAVKRRREAYDAHSPMLCRKLQEGDKVTLRESHLARLYLPAGAGL